MGLLDCLTDSFGTAADVNHDLEKEEKEEEEEEEEEEEVHCVCEMLFPSDQYPQSLWIGRRGLCTSWPTCC